MSESDGVYTIGHALNEQNARARGEPTEADKAHQKRTRSLRKRMGLGPTRVTMSHSAKPVVRANKTDKTVENTGRMSQAEFDGSKAAHDKLYEKDSSGKWVINCDAAKTYRHQVWEYMSKQRDDAGNLIRTEHPDARAVQLAVI